MTPEDASRLEFIDALRARGLKSYEGSGMKLEFSPPEAKPMKSTAPVADEKCLCGHHSHDEHMNGLCIRGCDPTTCSPEKK